MTPRIPSEAELAERLADPEFRLEQAAQLLAAEIGFQVRVARIELGLTIEEVAARAGATPRAVRIIERGEASRSLRPLTDLASKLDCRLCVSIEKPAASAIEAPSGVETGNTDSTEGESAAPAGGDAQ